ncbi:hypothetical protein B0H10DRAFT_1959605 [Mycena sp. CBHHK59/15]|nr:hypothetical protein B0H10DRAFT_1959605 [Mycena sp. CBHHK59/15]
MSRASLEARGRRWPETLETGSLACTFSTTFRTLQIQGKNLHNAHHDSIFGSPNSIYDHDSIYSHDGRNYSPKKNHLKAKSAPARGKAGKAKSAKGAVAPARGGGASKTNVVEPLVEEDLAEVEGDGEISNGAENADNLPAEDHSSNDPIPPMLPASPGTPPPPPRPRARLHHNEDSIPPSDAALTDLANDPFNLSGHVTLGKRLQVRTQVQRVEDDEDGHTDDGEEGLELEEQHDELYNFVDNSTLGYDDAVDFAELRAVAPHDLLPHCHSASPHRASSAKSQRPRRHSIDFPVRPSRCPPPSPSTPAVPPHQTGHDYRARAHSRSRSPPGAGASDHYRPRHSCSCSPAHAGSSCQYAGKYRDYSRGANSPPRARSPPRAPKSPRQQEPWPRNDDARQWDDPRRVFAPDAGRPPPHRLFMGGRVAAHVGAARHDDRAQGGGGVFLAKHLQEDDKPTRAAGFIFVHNPVRRVWKLLQANQAPVLATEEDRIHSLLYDLCIKVWDVPPIFVLNVGHPTLFLNKWDVPHSFGLVPWDIPQLFLRGWDVPPIFVLNVGHPTLFLNKWDVPRSFGLVQWDIPQLFLKGWDIPPIFVLNVGHPTLFLNKWDVPRSFGLVQWDIPQLFFEGVGHPTHAFTMFIL